jgi:DNA modification methylase
MMDEIYRVLKQAGTCWVNLGDTYSKEGMSGGNPSKFPEKLSIKRPKNEIKNKSLILLPHRFAIGCIDRGWIVRNDCIWAKRNGMPESVSDRFSKKHEYFFFMVKSQNYYFDLDAIRDKHQTSCSRTTRKMNEIQKHGSTSTFNGGNDYNENGKNPGAVSDFWDIPTKPSSSKHYASYNDSLLLKPVLAGCPEGGIIYDPFMGTGSTAEVALRSNRKFIGSEMSKDYCEIANKRLEPFKMQTSLF